MSTFLGVHSTKNLIEILHLAQLDLIQASYSDHWPFKFTCELLQTKNIEIQSSFLNFRNFWSNFLWNEVNKKLTTFIIPPLVYSTKKQYKKVLFFAPIDEVWVVCRCSVKSRIGVILHTRRPWSSDKVLITLLWCWIQRFWKTRRLRTYVRTSTTIFWWLGVGS